MAEQLITFEKFNPSTDSVYSIGDGVISEMSEAFGHDLTIVPDVDNIGQLIGAVGPAKELQENIGLVQEKLGTSRNSVEIATDWVDRSGLLLPVARSYMDVEIDADEYNFDTAVITGGVRNWMMRRAERLMPELDRVGRVALVAGNRLMKTTEGSDVQEGMTEADFMESVVGGLLSQAGVEVEVVHVDSGVGDEVMNAVAKHIDASDSILIASNAGAWVQNAGQLRRAVRSLHQGFDDDCSQLYVVSDSFPLGTGEEPTTTHQNPFTALGQIARNAQELVRQQS
ncbi:hypothetical protein KC968_00195 [Candidatus Saccharibacteria bacterium]|nr:hypothetical protein [Candidatus Saccharibacteria bacterium]